MTWMEGIATALCAPPLALVVIWFLGTLFEGYFR